VSQHQPVWKGHEPFYLNATPSPRTAKSLHRFLSWCVDSKIPELVTLARTVDAWWPPINTFVLTGIINARTDGYTRLVKTVKRAACGFRNPENTARRIRFHCTRTQRDAATQTSWLFKLERALILMTLLLPGGPGCSSTVSGGGCWRRCGIRRPSVWSVSPAG